MCSTMLPDGRIVTLTYDAAAGVDRRGEFFLCLGERSVPVAVPEPRFAASATAGAHSSRAPDRLSYTETTAFRLEDHLVRDLRHHFEIVPKAARVAARNLVWQMVRAHPGLVSFSTELPRGAAHPPCA